MAATPCFLSTRRAFSASAVLMRSTLMRSCQSAMAVPKVSFEAILTMVVLLSSDHAPYLFHACIGRQERKRAVAKRAMGNRRGPDDRGSAVLLSPVKLVDETALFHLVDEAQIDEVFRLGFARSWIGQGLNFQCLFQTFERRIGVFDEQLGVGRVGSLQDIPGQAAGGFLHDLDRHIFVGFEKVDRLRHRPDHPAHFVGIFPDLFTRRHGAVELKRHVELGHVDDHSQSQFFALDPFAVRDHGEIHLAAGDGGQVDFTVVTDGERIQGEKMGLRVIIDMAKLNVPFQFNCTVATRKKIRENPDEVRRVVWAMAESIHFFKTHKDVSVKIMQKYTRGLPRDVLEVAHAANSELLMEDTYPTLEGLKQTLEVQALTDPRASKARAEDFVELRFVDELKKSGFVDKLYGRR